MATMTPGMPRVPAQNTHILALAHAALGGFSTVSGQHCVCSTTCICSAAYPGKNHQAQTWLMNSFSGGLHQQVPPSSPCTFAASCMSTKCFLKVLHPRASATLAYQMVPTCLTAQPCHCLTQIGLTGLTRNTVHKYRPALR